MSKYELVTIVNAALPEDQKDGITKTVSDYVTQSGAKVINSQVWQEKFKFAFSIKKCAHGTYNLINFEGASSCVAKIKDSMKLNEDVIRFLIVEATK